MLGLLSIGRHLSSPVMQIITLQEIDSSFGSIRKCSLEKNVASDWKMIKVSSVQQLELESTQLHKQQKPKTSSLHCIPETS